MQRRQDPDNPFDGTASGVFEPLEHDTREPLIPLPKEGEATKKGRKIEKSFYPQHHTIVNGELRNREQAKKPEEADDQVRPKEKSDYLRKLPQQEGQGEIEVQLTKVQMKSPSPVEG